MENKQTELINLIGAIVHRLSSGTNPENIKKYVEQRMEEIGLTIPKVYAIPGIVQNEPKVDLSEIVSRYQTDHGGSGFTKVDLSGYIVVSSVENIHKILGSPLYCANNGGEVNFVWRKIYKDIPFGICDKDEHRSLEPTDVVEWNILTTEPEQAKEIALSLKQDILSIS